MKLFKTKVEKPGAPAGTYVTFNEDFDLVGKSGKLLCDVLHGSRSFFFSEEEELDLVKKID